MRGSHPAPLRACGCRSRAGRLSVPERMPDRKWACTSSPHSAGGSRAAETGVSPQPPPSYLPSSALLRIHFGKTVEPVRFSYNSSFSSSFFDVPMGSPFRPPHRERSPRRLPPGGLAMGVRRVNGLPHWPIDHARRLRSFVQHFRPQVRLTVTGGSMVASMADRPP